MADANQGTKPPEGKKPNRSAAIPIILGLALLAVAGAAQFGLIKLPKIDSGASAPGSKCPVRLTPSCGSVQNGVRVSGGIVKAPCPCPEADSTYASVDNITPGGPYNICVCK